MKRSNAPFHVFMRRLLPADADNDDRPGAGAFHFDSDLFWFLKEIAKRKKPAVAKIHDDAYEAIRRGEVYVVLASADLLASDIVLHTLREADVWLLYEVRAIAKELVDEITPAQKRWPLLVASIAYPIIRMRNILRGEN